MRRLVAPVSTLAVYTYERSSAIVRTIVQGVLRMTAISGSLTEAEAYFGAWNAHDPEAVAATFTEGGTYTGPTVCGHPLTGAAITEHARALLTAFPDLTFEIVGAHPAGGRQVMTQWVMHGTNTGPWNGQPPTSHSVAVQGVDVLTVTAGKITSAEG